ncbi:uncharacterized protein LAJ45_07569 [Morchella importuna]|uniref:uncharacterized protein n=1 Tax=Morchella importuna TaxID=1174673 RepID=UPI001E8D8D88|nr:uncharacterized protein LAJ45_07569 [Morchella importuna]KAH8148466.1 hypothetical protein LAJ45_07569 [Morchella importuna]
MFRLISKQTFKPMGVHHYHPRRVISTPPRRNTDDGGHRDEIWFCSVRYLGSLFLTEQERFYYAVETRPS